MEKITACVVAQDEEFTIEASLKSIAKHVDEIIIFENGSCDNTVEAINSMISNGLGVPVKFLNQDENISLAAIRNKVESLVSTEWLVWWDADFIASEGCNENSRSFSELIEDVRINSKKFNQVLFTGVNVGPCIGFDISGRPLHGSTGDTQIVRKGFMSFEVSSYVDSRVYLRDRRCRYLNYLNKSWFYHVDIKNPIRLAVRPFIHEYRRQKALGLFEKSLGHFLKFKLGHCDVFRLVDDYVRKCNDAFVSFDSNNWGGLPETILNLEELSPFSIRNGSLSLSDQGINMIDKYDWKRLLKG